MCELRSLQQTRLHFRNICPTLLHLSDKAFKQLLSYFCLDIHHGGLHDLYTSEFWSTYHGYNVICINNISQFFLIVVNVMHMAGCPMKWHHFS